MLREQRGMGGSLMTQCYKYKPKGELSWGLWRDMVHLKQSLLKSRTSMVLSVLRDCAAVIKITACDWPILAFLLIHCFAFGYHLNSSSSSFLIWHANNNTHLAELFSYLQQGFAQDQLLDKYLFNKLQSLGYSGEWHRQGLHSPGAHNDSSARGN